ncbi:transposase [Nonomuraea recticatena]|uniref:transposase n=1 Tax=Nonomuraea recticatena TaxID=46178 RepID=UPI00360D04BD
MFAAIIYVLVSGCAWRALPLCFGISKSTAHRRFVIWSRASLSRRMWPPRSVNGGNRPPGSRPRTVSQASTRPTVAELM